jgi:hypothetical protein
MLEIKGMVGGDISDRVVLSGEGNPGHNVRVHSVIIIAE